MLKFRMFNAVGAAYPALRLRKFPLVSLNWEPSLSYIQQDDQAASDLFSLGCQMSLRLFAVVGLENNVDVQGHNQSLPFPARVGSGRSDTHSF